VFCFLLPLRGSPPLLPQPNVTFYSIVFIDASPCCVRVLLVEADLFLILPPFFCLIEMKAIYSQRVFHILRQKFPSRFARRLALPAERSLFLLVSVPSFKCAARRPDLFAPSVPLLLSSLTRSPLSLSSLIGLFPRIHFLFLRSRGFVLADRARLSEIIFPLASSIRSAWDGPAQLGCSLLSSRYPSPCLIPRKPFLRQPADPLFV